MTRRTLADCLKGLDAERRPAGHLVLRRSQGTIASVVALLIALAGSDQAGAQTPQSATSNSTATASTSSQKRADPLAPQAVLQEVVVTASARPEEKFRTSYAITTTSSEQIRDAVPNGTADLLKVVPGIWVETTGGETDANIYVRGFAGSGNSPFVTLELDGVPMFAPSSISFMDNTNLFRLDDSVDHVETLIGGPGAIWGHGQPGATMNVIQKNGKDNPGGIVRLTAGTGGLYRADFYDGGQISDGWYGSVGGFYRTDRGIRDTQYPFDQGGQVEATLTHVFDGGGELTIYGRVLNDNNTFVTDIPMLAHGSGGNLSLSAFPGFNPLTATFNNDATRFITLDVGPNGKTQTVDMAPGSGARLTTLGMTLKKNLSDWDLVNRADYTTGELPNVGYFSEANPVQLSQAIATAVGAANSVAARNQDATIAGTTATLANTGAPLTDMDQWVIGESPWYADLHISSFQDDLRASHELFSGNVFSAGIYFADYQSQDLWFLGGNRLMTLSNSPQPVNINLDNDVVYSKNGLYSAPVYEVNASYNGNNEALVAADSWQLTEKLKADIGARWEHEEVNMDFENSSTSPNYTGNPLNLYDANGPYLNGTYTTERYSKSKEALTAGAAYEINRHLNTFIRYNSGYRLPSFDDLRSQEPNTPQLETIQQGELGIKAQAARFEADATSFYNTFKGVCNQVILTTGPQTECNNSRAYGLELDSAIGPFAGFGVDFTGTYQDATTTGSVPPGAPGCVYGSFACVDGNRQQDVPRWMSRITPNYFISTPVGDTKIWVTWSYVGLRYGDPQNLQVLPAYSTLDVGIEDTIGNFDISLTGTNVTNTLAVTEGSYRLEGTNGLTPYPGSATTQIFQGRPLFGAEYRLSVALHF
jgi:outer membrane receptor protein involved in Fe transport